MRRLSSGLAVCFGVVALVLATASAASPPPRCLVINDAINGSYGSVQAAVDAASAGDTLWVRGTCTGLVTIGKDLTLTGQALAKGFAPPTLDGAQQGTVVTVAPAAAVTINTLTITGGSASSVLSGGGIHNDGDLTLNSSVVSGNTTNNNGGGIMNGAALTLNDSAVSGNTANDDGGGIYNGDMAYRGGWLTLNNSVVSGNTATHEGGGIYMPSGGGICTLCGTLTLNNSTVSENAATNGAGIAAWGTGGLILNDTTVSGNTAAGRGGGIFGATLTVNDSTVSGNTAAAGGGLYVFGTSTLTDSTISDNEASGEGGGIHVQRYSTVNAYGVTISGNSADTGGGAYNEVGRLYLLDGSSVSGNTAASNGGGVWVYGFFVEMKPWGLVALAEGPTAPSTGSISDNTAGVHGAGIYVSEDGGFLYFCRDHDTGYGVNVYDNYLLSGILENIYKPNAPQ